MEVTIKTKNQYNNHVLRLKQENTLEQYWDLLTSKH